MPKLSQLQLDRIEKGLHERLLVAWKDRSYAQISEATGIHAETVRRNMNKGKMTSTQLIRMLQVSPVSELWLATGKGPRSKNDMTLYHLEQATTDQLFAEIASRLKTAVGKIETAEHCFQLLQDTVSGLTAVEKVSLGGVHAKAPQIPSHPQASAPNGNRF